MATFQKPRIVVEQSPWQTLFDKLPDMLLSFHQLKLQAEEKEKDRQHRENEIYLRHLLAEKRMWQGALIKKVDTLEESGAKLSMDFDNISSKTPENSTGQMIGGSTSKVLEDRSTMAQNEINDYKGMFLKASEQEDYFRLGEKDATAMDTDFDSLLSTEEIQTYQNANPELMEALGIPQLPENYLRGAMYHLTKDEVREQQEERKNLNAALNTMQIQWDFDKATKGYQEDPSIDDAVLSERRQAREAYDLGQYDNMYKHIIKSEAIKPSDTGDTLAGDEKEADLQFRTNMDIYQGQIDKTDEKFRASLPWSPAQDLKAGGFMSNVDTHKANLEKTLETWFTKTTGWNTKREIRNKYAEYYNQPENTGTEVEKRAYAVGKMMQDSTFMALIDTDDEVQSNFGWEGDAEEEKAAVQIFRTTINMYNQAFQWSGRRTGSITKMLEKRGIKKGTKVDEDPWITKNLGKGNK